MIYVWKIFPYPKEEIFSMSWATRTDLLTFNLPVFILKIYECKQVELSTDVLADFDHF